MNIEQVGVIMPNRRRVPNPSPLNPSPYNPPQNR